MDLLNQTPFAAERFLLAGQDGRETLLVVVRATFDLGKNGARISEAQPAPNKPDVYRGKPGVSSLSAASDLAWTKPNTDVIVTGCAYTSVNARSEALVALKVGSLLKAMRVVGDRTWTRGMMGLVPSAPQPFAQLPLIYERAYGGEGCAANPVGVGFSSKRMSDAPVPNIENARSSDGPEVPWGLGPIPPHWEPRSRHAGTYDETWKQERMPLLPTDFDPRYFQAVPPDQQLPGRLAGGEEVRIGGMRPEGALQWEVPRVRLAAEVETNDGETLIPLALDTLVIDCEALTASLVWRGTFNAHERVTELGNVTVTREDRG